MKVKVKDRVYNVLLTNKLFEGKEKLLSLVNHDNKEIFINTSQPFNEMSGTTFGIALGLVLNADNNLKLTRVQFDNVINCLCHNKDLVLEIAERINGFMGSRIIF